MHRRIGGRRAHPPAAAVALLALGVLAAPTSPAAFAQEAQQEAQQEAKSALPAPLVYLRDIDPTIVQDIRYAGPDNFTGRQVPGYGAGQCVLLRKAAEALARVQQSLLPRKLSLKVYDCYRPRRAVRAFVEWVRAGGPDPLLKRFHPNVERNQLIGLGYIASVSRHSRGDTVDLTLVQLPAEPAPPFEPGTVYGACNGPARERAPDAGVDMGTGYDCFDPLSHTDAPGIAPPQRRWRQTLVAAMAQQGFRNYRKEWWHFALTTTHPRRSFNVPILPRAP